jgi:hypothetical protein
MPEPDIDPLVKAVCEDRALALQQAIMDAQLGETPFPRETVRNVINLAVVDNTVGYLCYYLATVIDRQFAVLVEMRKNGGTWSYDLEADS